MIYNLLIAPFVDFDFMRRALAGVIVLAFGVAPVGVFLMLRRMSLMGDAMSHAILPGVAVAFLLSGLNRIAMTIGGLAAGLVVAVLSGVVTRSTQMKEDASLAAFYLISLALGVSIVSAHGTSLDLLEILFGNIRALDNDGLVVIAFNTSLSLVILAIIYRPLVIECVDPVFLSTMGRAGGMVSGYAGLVASIQTGVPAGPAIVLMAGAIYVLSLLFGSADGILRSIAPAHHLKA